MLQSISSCLPFLLLQTPPQNRTQVAVSSRCNARKIYSCGRLHPVPPPRPSSSRHQTISRLPLPSCRRRLPISRKATQIYLFLTVRSGTWMRTMLTSVAKAGAVPAQRRAALRSLMYYGEICCVVLRTLSSPSVGLFLPHNSAQIRQNVRRFD